MNDKDICFCEFGDMLDTKFTFKNIDNGIKNTTNPLDKDWTKLSEYFCDVCYYEDMI